MLKDLAAIALYLNMATKLIDKNKGSIEFLTGKKEDKISDNYSQFQFETQETQCLKYNSKLWIANNNDDESDIQRKFLEKIGVNKFSDLVKHVKKYGSLVLGNQSGKIAIKNNSFKELLLKKIYFDNLSVVQNSFTINKSRGGINTYKLNSSNPPPEQSVVFIKGEYKGDNKPNLHAEQKLLAAFGKYLEKHPNLSGKFHITGCKAPCSTCKEVLRKLYDKLIRLRYKYYLEFFYHDSNLNVYREEAKLGVFTTSNVKSIDLETYYNKFFQK